MNVNNNKNNYNLCYFFFQKRFTINFFLLCKKKFKKSINEFFTITKLFNSYIVGCSHLNNISMFKFITGNDSPVVTHSLGKPSEAIANFLRQAKLGHVPDRFMCKSFST